MFLDPEVYRELYPYLFVIFEYQHLQIAFVNYSSETGKENI